MFSSCNFLCSIFMWNLKLGIQPLFSFSIQDPFCLFSGHSSVCILLLSLLYSIFSSVSSHISTLIFQLPHHLGCCSLYYFKFLDMYFFLLGDQGISAYSNFYRGISAYSNFYQGISAYSNFLPNYSGYYFHHIFIQTYLRQVQTHTRTGRQECQAYFCWANASYLFFGRWAEDPGCGIIPHGLYPIGMRQFGDTVLPYGGLHPLSRFQFWLNQRVTVCVYTVTPRYSPILYCNKAIVVKTTDNNTKNIHMIKNRYGVVQ